MSTECPTVITDAKLFNQMAALYTPRRQLPRAIFVAFWGELPDALEI
jgi:hypothetical protein